MGFSGLFVGPQIKVRFGHAFSGSACWV